MSVYKDYISFDIMGDKVSIISDETSHGRNTVAEIDGNYHYLGDEFHGIAAAIFAWQEVNGTDLTVDELHQIMLDNHIISEGI
jgi:hypothetical protein